MMDLTKLDTSSSSRFVISLGTFFLFFSGIIYYFLLKTQFSNEKTIYLIFILVFVISGFILLSLGINQLVKEEKFMKKYRQEFMVTQIIEQDLKYQELLDKNLEFNTKAHKYNEQHPQADHRPFYEISKIRGFDSIEKQAINYDWYERHNMKKKDKVK